MSGMVRRIDGNARVVPVSDIDAILDLHKN